MAITAIFSTDNDDKTWPGIELEHVPVKGDLVRLEDAAYEIKSVVLSLWPNEPGKMQTLHVSVKPVDSDEDYDIRDSVL